jgi:hypothetical protein
MTTWRGEGKSLRHIAGELNRLNIRTVQGNQWYACTVSSQLKGKETLPSLQAS